MIILFALCGCNLKEGIGDNTREASRAAKASSVEEGQEEHDGAAAYGAKEETLISWMDEEKKRQRVETEEYYIQPIHSGEKTYPQIVMKEGKALFCGVDFFNNLLNSLEGEYTILYADNNYLSIATDAGMTYVINLKNPGYMVDWDRKIHLQYYQDDNDYPEGFWLGNGIEVPLEKMILGIEAGNYYMDETGYTLYKENPDLFIENIHSWFAKIKAGGYAQSYTLRGSLGFRKVGYQMYIREGRVGFMVDFEGWGMRLPIEVAYDWKQNAASYHMPYEVYSMAYTDEKCGEIPYPQIRGIEKEAEAKLNRAMKQNVINNLQHIDIEATNKIMERYGYEKYWESNPVIGPPRVIFQSERYLCIRQEPIEAREEILRFASGWQRDYVYDLVTGESLRLEDILHLDEEFVKWLKEEKKVHGGRWLNDMYELEKVPEYVHEDLEAYPEEFLLEVLLDCEFYMKSDRLFIRLPEVYMLSTGEPTVLMDGGGTGHISYIFYDDCGILVEDLEKFLKAESW